VEEKMTDATNEYVLPDWADQEEGEVYTAGSAVCDNPLCSHASHSDYEQRYLITKVKGSLLWRGELGEYLLRSEGGRLFYCRYYENPENEYHVVKATYELRDGRLPADLWKILLKRYGSKRHVVLKELLKHVEHE
jgi:hypothetical protein